MVVYRDMYCPFCGAPMSGDGEWIWKQETKELEKKLKKKELDKYFKLMIDSSKWLKYITLLFKGQKKALHNYYDLEGDSFTFVDDKGNKYEFIYEQIPFIALHTLLEICKKNY